ncbi:MAG: tetratricopeptide repeat protein [Raineya sp.]|nr:tetratricopeptide repeat protein [Raineya sp.]
MFQIASIYQEQKAYKKAVEYYEKSLQIDPKTRYVIIKRQLMNNYIALHDYANILKTGEELASYHRNRKEDNEIINVLEECSEYAQHSKQYQKALTYNQELLDLYEKKNDKNGLSHTYNNLGVIYRRLGEKDKSAFYFNKALEINKQETNNPNYTDEKRVLTYINSGVTYLQIKDYKKANYYFEEALKIANQTNNPKVKASAANYLAMAYFLSDRNNEALDKANEARIIAENNKDVENQLASYKVLSMIYQAQANYKDAQEYVTKYQELSAERERKHQQEIQKSLEQEIAVERKESEIRAILAEQERREAALRESELLREKAEKELALQKEHLASLQKDKALQAARIRQQQIEKQQIENLLALAQQKAETEKQKSEAERQRAEAERQAFIAENERLEKERKQKDLDLAREQQALKDATIRQQKQIQYLLFGIAIVILGALFLVIRSLNITKKLNKQLGEKNVQIEKQNIELKEKQQEINLQNEELQQQQEEIRAQRDALDAVNKELDKKNKDLTSSIMYASRIQRGILPSSSNISKFIPKHFILFLPRDIVSGDFYWFAEAEDMCMIVAADCTGHGVPGALMSMIASASLNKAFFEYQARSPEKLLSAASNEIIKVLDQVHSQTNDGMDASACAYFPKENKLLFASAKNPIFYVKGGVMQEIKGDNQPVGDFNYGFDRKFTLHEVSITEPLTIYMFSDGYPDQFGGSKAKKLGRRKFQEILLEIYQKPMENQQKYLHIFHQKWKNEAGETQTDDILVIGFCVEPQFT